MAQRISTMSMPRRAMQEMGFQACCLFCDAVDTIGTSRCKSCISSHRIVRTKLLDTSYDTPVAKLARELMAMTAAPHRYDHDETHGEILREQQRLAVELMGESPKIDIEDISKIFESQKSKSGRNIIQDIANNNPWKDSAPPAEVANFIGKEAWSDEELAKYANIETRRTVPSKEISKVDRSDRLGEDHELLDRIKSKQVSALGPAELEDIIEESIIEARVEKRDRMSQALDDVLDLLED